MRGDISKAISELETIGRVFGLAQTTGVNHPLIKISEHEEPASSGVASGAHPRNSFVARIVHRTDGPSRSWRTTCSA